MKIVAKNNIKGILNTRIESLENKNNWKSFYFKMQKKYIHVALTCTKQWGCNFSLFLVNFINLTSCRFIYLLSSDVLRISKKKFHIINYLKTPQRCTNLSSKFLPFVIIILKDIYILKKIPGALHKGKHQKINNKKCRKYKEISLVFLISQQLLLPCSSYPLAIQTNNIICPIIGGLQTTSKPKKYK